MARIPEGYSLKNDEGFNNKTPEYLKEGSNKLLNFLKTMDYYEFKKDLKVRNFNISDDELKSTTDKIIFNLKTIRSSGKIDLTDKKY